LYGDPEAVVFIGNKPDPDVAATREALTRFAAAYEANRGLGYWAVALRDGGQVIGSVILRPLPGHPEIEIGWHFARKFWGQGYATEAARGALAYGNQAYGFERIVAVIHPANSRSLALAHRLGLIHEGQIEAFQQKLELFVWSQKQSPETAALIVAPRH